MWKETWDMERTQYSQPQLHLVWNLFIESTSCLLHCRKGSSTSFPLTGLGWECCCHKVQNSGMIIRLASLNIVKTKKWTDSFSLTKYYLTLISLFSFNKTVLAPCFTPSVISSMIYPAFYARNIKFIWDFSIWLVKSLVVSIPDDSWNCIPSLSPPQLP